MKCPSDGNELEKVSGDLQTVVVGEAPPQPLVVRVRRPGLAQARRDVSMTRSPTSFADTSSAR